MQRATRARSLPCRGSVGFLTALGALVVFAWSLLYRQFDLKAAAADGKAAPGQTDWAAALWERAASVWDQELSSDRAAQELSNEDAVQDLAEDLERLERRDDEQTSAGQPSAGGAKSPGQSAGAAGNISLEAQKEIIKMLEEREAARREGEEGGQRLYHPEKQPWKTGGSKMGEPCTGQCRVGKRGFNYSERCVVRNETQAAEFEESLKALHVTLGRQKVGASIAIHPPRFYAVAQFLAEYVSCPPAVEALGIFLVFTKEADAELFREAMKCLHPEVPEGAWTPVVCAPPEKGWNSIGHDNQYISAYKKWHGVAAMMDMGKHAPEYGLMVDAELLLYDLHAPDTHRRGCGAESEWPRFLPRIRAKEAAKEWVAARVSATLKVYMLGSTKQTGKSFDQMLISGNANFISRGQLSVNGGKKCTSEACDEVRRQYRDALFTWWTDLPWMNLSVVKRLFGNLSRRDNKTDTWVDLSTRVKWHRFEHVGYQQWAVLHEGFTFKDVTNWTGEAKWGSFLEDPQPNCSLKEVEPLWVSGHALERSELGTIIGPPAHAPPFLIFHSDQAKPRGNYLPKRKLLKKVWAKVLTDILKLQGRREYSLKSIER